MRRVAAALLAVAAAGGCSALTNTTFFHPGDRSQPAACPPGTRDLRTVTADGVRIQLLHVRRAEPHRCILYFHGNAGTAWHRLPAAQALASAAYADVLLVEYRGYGASDGSPSEDGVYADGRAAFDFAVQSLGYRPDQIVVLGRSLGSAVAVQLLTEVEAAGAVLVSPFTSGRDMAGALGYGAVGWMLGRPFETLSRMPHVAEPLLVVHGTDDEVVPFVQGRRVFEAAPGPKRFLPVQGGTHNGPLLDYHRVAAFARQAAPLRRR